MKVHMILPELLYQRGNLKSKSRAEKAALLTQYNIGLVAQLANHRDADLAELALEYHYFPIPDSGNVPYDKLEALAAKLLAGAQAHGRAILTLCNAGRNRSGLLSALIVARAQGATGSSAMGVVRAGRPRALANEAFAAYLEARA